MYAAKRTSMSIRASALSGVAVEGVFCQFVGTKAIYGAPFGSGGNDDEPRRVRQARGERIVDDVIRCRLDVVTAGLDRDPAGAALVAGRRDQASRSAVGRDRPP